eukprot:jgi/Hompol1/2381/HPOL_001439-RA
MTEVNVRAKVSGRGKLSILKESFGLDVTLSDSHNVTCNVIATHEIITELYKKLEAMSGVFTLRISQKGLEIVSMKTT